MVMFIDIHVHAFKRPQPYINGEKWFGTPEEVIGRYDELDIECGVLLPLIGPEVYIGQSNEEIIEMAEESGGRFIPFCNIDPRALTNSPDAPLGDLLRYYRDLGCKGIGEVMPNLPFRDPRMQNLFKCVEDVGFPLIFDLSATIGGDYGIYDDPGLPQLEECLQKFPNLRILGHSQVFWSEIAQLDSPIDRAGYPDYPLKEEGVVPKLMRRYENLHGDLSAGSGYNALARDPEYAAKFLTEFQDKLFFGTDICLPTLPTPLAGFLLELLEKQKISQTAFNKIAKENAIKLLGLQNDKVVKASLKQEKDNG